MLLLAFKYAAKADEYKAKGKIADELIYATLAGIAFKNWKKQITTRLLTT